MNVIEVNNVTKIYRLYKSSRDRLSEIISLNRKKYHHDFHALKDVSLAIKKGETIGIIGQNGSGKSTLLKIICGVTKPTNGTVMVNGRISSLLELGAGFNPDFTGRENVYMNGALMGFNRKEMDQRLIDIAEFAQIGEFLDQPVKTYSSGMYMRLAFSAAINVDPDIFIIDEILAVGDEDFQNKCHQKIQELRHAGKTILLVSHDLFTVEHICSKVWILDHGTCIIEGQPSEAIPLYHRFLNSKHVSKQIYPGNLSNVLPDESWKNQLCTPPIYKRWGTKDVEITSVSFLNEDKEKVSGEFFTTNDKFVARIEFIAHKKITHPVFGIAIYSNDGTIISGSNTKGSNLDIPSIEDKGVIEYSVEALPLLPGKYFFSVSVSDYDVFLAYDLWHKCLSFTVVPTESVKGQTGFLPLTNNWCLLE
jgi:ABC-type polysaccharide/polyol phosphate transport system ATPase subunit